MRCDVVLWQGSSKGHREYFRLARANPLSGFCAKLARLKFQVARISREKIVDLNLGLCSRMADAIFLFDALSISDNI